MGIPVDRRLEHRREWRRYNWSFPGRLTVSPVLGPKWRTKTLTVFPGSCFNVNNVNMNWYDSTPSCGHVDQWWGDHA